MNDKKISYKDLNVKRVFPLQKKLFLALCIFRIFGFLKFLKFGSDKIEKKFHHYKKLIDVNNLDIEKILVWPVYQ